MQRHQISPANEKSCIGYLGCVTFAAMAHSVDWRPALEFWLTLCLVLWLLLEVLLLLRWGLFVQIFFFHGRRPDTFCILSKFSGFAYELLLSQPHKLLNKSLSHCILWLRNCIHAIDPLLIPRFHSLWTCSFFPHFSLDRCIRQRRRLSWKLDLLAREGFNVCSGQTLSTYREKTNRALWHGEWFNLLFSSEMKSVPVSFWAWLMWVIMSLRHQKVRS